MDFYLRLSSLSVFWRFTHIVAAMYPLNKLKTKVFEFLQAHVFLLSPCFAVKLKFLCQPHWHLLVPGPWLSLPSAVAHPLSPHQAVGSASSFTASPSGLGSGLRPCPETHVDRPESLPEPFLLWTLNFQPLIAGVSVGDQGLGENGEGEAVPQGSCFSKGSQGGALLT